MDDEAKSPAWNDWRWQLANSCGSLLQLPPDLAAAAGADRGAVARAVARFPMAVTPYYLELMDPGDPEDPIAKMAVPSPAELESTPGLSGDPIDEEAHSPLPGVIRRYPDRAVLLVSGRCAVNCRHCTRRGLGRGRIRPLAQDGLRQAIEYLKDRPEIRDVILSGGDPLLLETPELEEILTRVRSVRSVEIIRVGTRVPVTLPMRVDLELVQTLSGFHPLYINTQFNHPREITDNAARAAALLADAGIPLANQAVLLRGVNDTPETIEELSRALLRIRVRPYYLFLSDLWEGIEHLRAPLETGVRIMEHLRGRLSGLGIPQLVVDLPGGHGKIPVGPDYIVAQQEEGTVLRAPDGRQVFYPRPKMTGK